MPVDDLEKVRDYCKWIKASFILIDHMKRDAEHWDKMPAYLRHGRLLYFGLLRGFLDSARYGVEKGYIKGSYLKEYRKLKRIAGDALGTYEWLKKRDKELCRIEEKLEKREGSG